MKTSQQLINRGQAGVLMSAIVLGLSLGACRTSAPTQNASSLNDLVSMDNLKPLASAANMAEWLRLKRAEIQSRTDYLRAMQDIAVGIDNYQYGGNVMRLSGTSDKRQGQLEALRNLVMERAGVIERSGWNLAQLMTVPEFNQTIDQGLKINAAEAAQRQQEADLQARLAQQQAQVAGVYADLANKPAEQWIRNMQGSLQNQRLGIDNEGARIGNFGKMLENQSKGLENVLKQYEILLKSYYSVGYANYIDSYATYSNNIERIYAKLGAASDQMLTPAFSAMRKYRRQTAICEGRVKRIERNQLFRANAEMAGKLVQFSNIPATLRTLAASPQGETCLNKVLLQSKFINAPELFFLNYQVTFANGSKVFTQCPSINGLPAEDGMSAIDYPPAILDPQTYDVRGFYQPMTYYQYYRLVTEAAADVSLAPPSAVSKPKCNNHHPGVISFISESQKLESALAESYADARTTLGAVPSTGYVAQQTTSNPYYLAFLNRMTVIFQRTQACINTPATPGDAPPVVAAPPAGATPLETGKPASSNLSTYFDPAFPQMSEFINDCMKTAEHYRYMAYQAMESTDKMVDLLSKAAKIPPPRSPHPTQFTPVGVNPGTTPGNN